ncbi:hypothetical protein TWF694_001470 [Orbilia ellipsospora]|uniref:CHAT domain-containing protein n=1 Tax=Orbilia ellipsospora TaxID=2528407 RepID=A0AAV9XRP7_9PEZI
MMQAPGTLTNPQKGVAQSMEDKKTEKIKEIKLMISQIASSPAIDPETEIDLRRGLRELLFQEFERTLLTKYLNEAIEETAKILEIVPSNDPLRPAELDRLGFIKTSRFQINKSRQDIDHAIILSREALSLIDEGDPQWFNFTNNLSFNISARYKQFGEIEDLDEALLIGKQILQKAPQGHPFHLTALSNLGARLILRFQKQQNLSDCEEAMSINNILLKEASPGSVHYLQAQQNLAAIFTQKYDTGGKFWQNLDEAIRLQRLVVTSLPYNQEYRPQILHSLGMLLYRRYTGTKKIADLKESLKYSQEAIAAVPVMQTFESRRGDYILKHLQKLKELAQVTTELSTVEDAVTDVEDLLASQPETYREELMNTYYYGCLLSRRYELSSRPYDFSMLVMCAIGFASRTPCISEGEDKGKPYDVSTLLTLNYHSMNLMAKPQDDYIVAQMATSIHREYCKLRTSKDYMMALISLERDVVLNVEIVSFVGGGRSREDMEDDISKGEELARSLGAKTVQLRIKLLDLMLSTGPSGSQGRQNTPPEAKQNNGKQTRAHKTDQLPSLTDLTKLLNSFNLSGKPNSDTEILPEKNARKVVDISGAVYREIHQQRGAKAIEYHQEAITGLKKLSQYLDENDTTLSEVLDHLSAVLLNSYQITLTVDTLKEATTTIMRSISLVPQKELETPRTSVLCNLAGCLRSCYLETRDEDMLDDSYLVASAAVDATPLPKEMPTKPGANRYYVAARLHLANTLKSKYQMRGGFNDLEAAIQCVQEAMEIHAKAFFGDVTAAASCINQFALMMRLRYIETGEINDLEVGIQRIESFLKESPQDALREDPSTRLALISNLGLLFQQKCERTDKLDDIETAIAYCRQALKIAGDEAPVSSGIMQNLSSNYHHRFCKTKEREDLELAVKYTQKSVQLNAEFNQIKPVAFIDGGITMKASYGVTQKMEDLQQATEWLERGVSMLLPTDVTLPYALYELCQALELQNEAAPSDEIADRCLESYRKVVDSPLRTRAWVRLSAFQALFRLLAQRSRWAEALETIEKLIAQMSVICPRWLPAGDRQYLMTFFHGVAENAAAIALQEASPNRAYNALRLLESSRGVILASTLDYRSEAKHLEAVSIDLLREWNELCNELGNSEEEIKQSQPSRQQEVSKLLYETLALIRQIPGFSNFSPPISLGSMVAHDLKAASPQLFELYTTIQRAYEAFSMTREGGRQTKRQRELTSQMDELLVRIRQLPGLEGFLLPLNEEAMINLANEGPIIVVNYSGTVNRGDAIIIQSSGIEVLPLPELSYFEIQYWMNKQKELIRGWTPRNISGKHKEMRELLLWLWESTVKPILDHLGMSSAVPLGERKRRVHWIGIGILGMVPFHAAGDHSPESTENAISRVISSYTPTLRTLSFAQDGLASKDRLNARLHRQVLVVSVPDAPGVHRLQAADAEADSVALMAAPHAAVTRLRGPDSNTVAQELPLANIAHFACHAMLDPVDVSDSHLVLMPEPEPALKKSSNFSPSEVVEDASSRADIPKPGKLTVRGISAKRAPAAELAFLSACSVAGNSAPHLTDEVIHIASAFQLAGFKHVVGTLWKSRDDCCSEVAYEFYRELFGSTYNQESGAEKLEVAEALDVAVCKLRENGPEKVLAWAPFIHIGA